MAQVARMLLQPARAARALHRQHPVLRAVVAQHQLRHLVGHLGEQAVALLAGELAVGHHLVEQDLDVDLVVGAVHPA